MNRKNIEQENERFDNGEYAVRRSRRANIIAAVVCLVLAFCVWLVVMNTQDTAYLPVEVPEGGAYVLSMTSLEVKGTVTAIKDADRIRVKLPEGLQPGDEVVLTEQNLIFPDGVRPVEDVYLIVKVVK